MATVCYAASHGDYSDHGVCAVFSTREKAEAWRESKNVAAKCGKCGGTGMEREMVSRRLTDEESKAFAENFAAGKILIEINGHPATLDQAISMACMHEITGNTVKCSKCGGGGSVTINEYRIEEFDFDVDPDEVPR